MKYHVNSTGYSKDGFVRGLKKSLELSIKNKTKEVALAINTKQQLRRGIISDVLGDNFVKDIDKNGCVSIGGVSIYLLTERIASNFKKGVILACHPSSQFMEKLAKDYRATDIVYIPWALEEYTDYLSQNKSIEISL